MKTCYVLIATVFVVLLLASCSLEHTELQRVISPDGSYVAIVERLDGGGAAGTRSYVLMIMNKGSDKRLNTTLLKATQCESMMPVWEDDATLVVSYDAYCHVRNFQNYWQVHSTKGERQVVTTIEIILKRTAGERTSTYKW